MKKILYISTFLILMFSSCNRIFPSFFWIDFDKKLIVKDISDQGPWGGQRVIHFASDKKGRFNTDRILSYAFEHGWTLLDSINYSIVELKLWKDKNKFNFPVYLKGFETRDSILYNNFPRLINSDLTVYRFKTHWLIYYPGTDNSTNENGYILLNKNRDSMSVYHLWGE